MPAAETRKYDPGNRPRSRSPAHPPSSVAINPLTTTTPPNTRLTRARLPAVPCSSTYRGIQNPTPPMANVIAVMPSVSSTYDGVRSSTR